MSDFQTINTWVNTHLKETVDYSTVTPLLLHDLQAMADNEDKVLSNRVFNIMSNYQRDDQLRALSSLHSRDHIANTDMYMENAFAVVILKAAPTGTDGVFVILQIVPGQYVLKTTLIADREYNLTGLTHVFLSQYISPTMKPVVMTGSNNGPCQQQIFSIKNKHDNYERMEEFEYGDNLPFKITLPNGTTVIP